MHHTRHRRAAMAGALVVTLLASACTIGGDNGDSTSEKDEVSTADQGTADQGNPAARPAQLRQLWESPADRRISSLSAEASHVWTSDTIIAVRYGSSVRGYETGSGERRWEMRLPEGFTDVCAMSEELNVDGIGGLLLEHSTAGCSYTAAVDIADGSMLWHRSMGEQDVSLGDFSVSVGEETVTADVSCGEVRRFSLAGGKPLPSPQERDRLCAHEADHSGRLLAVRNDPASHDTPDDAGTGWIPPHEGKAAFQLYDADSGKQLWQRAVNRLGTELHRIIAVDPLTLDTTERGHRLVRTYDDDGKPLTTIGKTLGFSAGMTVFGTADGVLVAGYDNHQRDLAGATTSIPRVHAYDLGTGQELWSRPQEGLQPLGIQRGGLLAIQVVYPDPQNNPGVTELWVTRHDLRVPDDSQMLGRIPLDGAPPQPLAWDDERLYMLDTTGDEPQLVAYELPEEGDNEQYAGRPVNAAADDGWLDSDLRPEDIDDVCEMVRARTRTTMGFRSTDLPPPADCTWAERYQPRGVDRSLDVVVTTYAPEPDRSAVAHAEAEFQRLRTDSSGGLTEEHQVSDLGDEASAVTRTSVDGAWTASEVLVRHRNVTIQVNAEVEALLSRHRPDAAAPHWIEHAALGAAGDVLRQLGATVTPPRSPDAATFDRARPVCAPLRANAAALVPGAKAEDLTAKGGADDRATGCYWQAEEDHGPDLAVHVYAVPASAVSGDDATTTATEMFDGWRSGTTDVTGVGDSATLDRFEFENGRSRTHTLLVQKDNLLIMVEHGRWHRPSKQQMDTDLERIARKVLTEYE